MNTKHMVIAAAMAVMLVGATALTTADSVFAGVLGHKKKTEYNQATSQANARGNVSYRDGFKRGTRSKKTTISSLTTNTFRSRLQSPTRRSILSLWLSRVSNIARALYFAQQNMKYMCLLTSSLT
jgi:hypothetical protein